MDVDNVLDKVLLNTILFDEDSTANYWRSKVFTNYSTEFNTPIISEKSFINFSNTFQFSDSVS